MNCRQADERLSAWLDGELAPPEAEEVRRHLESCTACRAAFEQLQRTVQAVKDLPVVPAPKGFRADVMAEVKSDAATAIEKGPQHARRAPRWRMLWPAAAAVLIAVVLALINERPPRVRDRKRAEKPQTTGSEIHEAEGVAPAAPSDENMRRLEGWAAAPRAAGPAEPSPRTPAPLQAAPDAFGMHEERGPVADKAHVSRPGAGLDGFALAEEADGAAGLEGAPRMKDATEASGGVSPEVAAEAEAPPAETGLAFALDETARTEDAEVWTVVAADPDAARARLDAVAVANRWEILPEEQVKDDEKGAAAAPRLDLRVLQSQLPALSQAVRGLAAPARPAPVGERHAAREVTNEVADAAQAPAATAERREPLRALRHRGGETATMALSPADAVRVTVYFRALEADIAPPAADAARTAPGDPAD